MPAPGNLGEILRVSFDPSMRTAVALLVGRRLVALCHPSIWTAIAGSGVWDRLNHCIGWWVILNKGRKANCRVRRLWGWPVGVVRLSIRDWLLMNCWSMWGAVAVSRRSTEYPRHLFQQKILWYVLLRHRPPDYHDHKGHPLALSRHKSGVPV